MISDYILRVKGRSDQPLTKEEALECFQILETRDSSVTLRVGWRMVWYFLKKDIRIEKPESSQDNPEYNQERSRRFAELRVKRENWTDATIKSMRTEELETFKQMAIARFWNWYERSRLSLNTDWFDRYIAWYVRILISWKKWYRDDENTYQSEHFMNWHNMVERPDMLPQ